MHIVRAYTQTHGAVFLNPERECLLQDTADPEPAQTNADHGDDPQRLLRRAKTVLARRSNMLVVLEHCHSARERKVRREACLFGDIPSSPWSASGACCHEPVSNTCRTPPRV